MAAYLFAAFFVLLGTRTKYNSGMIDGTQAAIRLGVILVIVVGAIVPVATRSHPRAAEIRAGSNFVMLLCLAVLLISG